jgi:hypothetical protein
MNFEELSRRSFIKTTTVLAVGVASVTLFAGLAHAAAYAQCSPKNQQWRYDPRDGGYCWIQVECNGKAAKLWYGEILDACPTAAQDPVRHAECVGYQHQTMIGMEWCETLV